MTMLTHSESLLFLILSFRDASSVAVRGRLLELTHFVGPPKDAYGIADISPGGAAAVAAQ